MQRWNPFFFEEITSPLSIAYRCESPFFVGKNLEARKKIKRYIVESYGLRSAFVHHGKERKDDKVLLELMRITLSTMLGLMVNISRFESKDKFLDSLDDHLYSSRTDS